MATRRVVVGWRIMSTAFRCLGSQPAKWADFLMGGDLGAGNEPQRLMEGTERERHVISYFTTSCAIINQSDVATNARDLLKAC